MYRELTVSSDIPKAKLRNAFKLGKLNLTASELKGSGSVLHLHPESYVKAIKARKAGRGVRLEITRHEVKKGHKRAQGGSIWHKVWDGIKTVFKAAKDSGVLSKIADVAIPAAATFLGAPAAAIPIRAGLKSLTGVGVDSYDSDSDVEGGKLSMAEIKAGAKQALRYAKQKGILTDIVDAGEAKLISKASKPEHVEMVKLARKSVKTKYGVGVKGSPEAKAHMAKLRSMRKQKASGGSFRL